MFLLIVAHVPPFEPYLGKVVQLFEFVQIVNCKLSIHKPLHTMTEPIYEPARENVAILEIRNT
jgi:hypothetical protein